MRMNLISDLQGVMGSAAGGGGGRGAAAPRFWRKVKISI